MLSSDIADIQEYAIHNIEYYYENYYSYGSYLTFSDYVLTRLTVQLMHKYNKYDVQEAMSDHRMVAILKFYTDNTEENDDEQEN